MLTVLKRFSRRQNTKYKIFYFIMIFRFHLEKAVFKLKPYKGWLHDVYINQIIESNHKVNQSTFVTFQFENGFL